MSKHEGSRSAYLGAVLAAYAAKLGQEPHAYRISLAVEEMQRATRAAKGWSTRLCNEAMDEAQEERGSKRIARLQDQVQAAVDIALNWCPGASDPAQRATVDLGGDPRGPCGRLHIPGQRGDGWGDGFAIYQEGTR